MPIYHWLSTELLQTAYEITVIEESVYRPCRVRYFEFLSAITAIETSMKVQRPYFN